MTLEHSEDRVEQAIARLPGLFQDLPNWQALITALVGECQELEDVFYDLLVDGILANSKGATLDQYGDLLGEERATLSDEVYRGVLRARIRANRSNGAPEELIKVALLLGALDVTLFEHFPATASVEMVVPDSFDISGSEASRRSSIVERAAAGGVFVRVVEAHAGHFGFAENADARGFDVGKLARRTDGS